MINKYLVAKKSLEGLFAVIIVAGIIFFLALPSFILACIVLIITGIVITVLLRKEYTYSIIIDSESRTVTFITKSLTSSETDVCGFDEINFVYKKRLDYYSYSSNYGPREKRNILLIDSKRKTLAYLVPKQDGWSNEVILDLAKTLAELSIKQIVEKYNDDEIAL